MWLLMTLRSPSLLTRQWKLWKCWKRRTGYFRTGRWRMVSLRVEIAGLDINGCICRSGRCNITYCMLLLFCQILLNTSDEAQLMAVTSIACNLLLEFSPSKEVTGYVFSGWLLVHTCCKFVLHWNVKFIEDHVLCWRYICGSQLLMMFCCWSTCCKMLKPWLIALWIWHDTRILEYASMLSGH